MQQPDPKEVAVYKDRMATSVVGWQAFKQSSMWIDMKAWLEERLELIKNDALMADDLEALRSLQGEADAFQQVLLLPDAYINYLNEN